VSCGPPWRGWSTSVDEGRALFHDEEVGCAGCHDSERAFTDGKNHDVGSLLRREVAFAQEPAFGFLLSIGTGSRSKTKPPAAFNTPSLKHLALTPPYLHDGSAPTLSALIEDNHDRMGATSQLTPRERTALVASLEAL
jgi:cytochrome c peroxidase